MTERYWTRQESAFFFEKKNQKTFIRLKKQGAQQDRRPAPHESLRKLTMTRMHSVPIAWFSFNKACYKTADFGKLYEESIWLLNAQSGTVAGRRHQTGIRPSSPTPVHRPGASQSGAQD
jgi:hypothetical protein